MTGAALALVAFWLLLALPGYALLRRSAQPWLTGAWPSDYALSCMATFALLTPVSGAAYALELPLWVLTASIVLAVVAAAVSLARSVQWRLPRSRPSLVAVLASAVIAADAVLGLASGGHLGGDAVYHRGRVRMLLAYGVNSLDPMVEGRVDPIYLGNLYHALMGASAQLTGLEASHAWAYALPWAKLMTAGAIQFLAWTVLRDRILAWITAAAFAVYMASSSVLLYPNKIATYALVPLAIAFAVRVLAGEDRLRAAAGLGAAALATAQVHVLYYTFACLLIGPALLVALVRAQLQHVPERRAFVAALAALALGLPWLGASVLERATPDRPPERAPPAIVAPASTAVVVPGAATDPRIASEARRNRGFLQLPGDQIMFDPSGLLHPLSLHTLLVLALALGMATSRANAVRALCGPVAAGFAALYLPPLSTVLAQAAGAPWVLGRLSSVLGAIGLAVVPGALLLFLRERGTPRWLYALLLLLPLVHGYARGVDKEPWTRARYLTKAMDPAKLRDDVDAHVRRRALFMRNIPRGTTVLTSLADAADLALDCDCYPFAIEDLSRGLADMDQRRAAASLLLGTELDLDARVALLRHYRIGAIWVRGRRAGKLAKIYRPVIAREEKSGRNRILVLDLSRTATAQMPSALR